MLIPVKQKDISSNLLDNLFDTFFNDRYLLHNSANLAPIDIKEDDQQITVNTEIPGLDKKDIQVEHHDRILTITGEKKVENKDYTYREIVSGKFSRSVNVGDVVFENAQAEYKDGILSIKLPKQAKQQAHRLEIQ